MGRRVHTPRSVARLLLVVGLLAAAGCSSLGVSSDAADELPPERVAADRYASLDAVGATVTTVRERNGETTTTVVQRRERVGSFASFERVQSVDRSDGAREPLVSEGGFVVVNESALVFYDPASEQVSRVSLPAEDGSEGAPYPALVGAARSGEPVEQPTPTPGVSPLPAVPAADGADGNGSTAYRDGNVTVAYAGTETVAGLSAYRLEVTPVSEGMSLRSQTLWLDTEHLFPVKRHTEFTANGDDYTYTVTYRNVTFDPSLGPGAFRVGPEEIPDDARQVRFDNYDSRAGLAAAVEIPVPDPAVPPGFEFESASHRSSDPELASLRYESADGDTSLRVGVLAERQNVTDGRAVQVGPYTARQSRSNGTATVTWATDGATYYVRGGVDNGTLRRVARSVTETTRAGPT